MLDKLKLKFGTSPGQPNLEVNISPITIFVGPNNSGKSIILREIEEYCTKPSGSIQIIVDNIEFSPLTETYVVSEIEKIKLPGKPTNPDEVSVTALTSSSGNSSKRGINLKYLLEEVRTPTPQRGWQKLFLALYTLRLDGKNRLTLLTEQDAGDMQEHPKSYLSKLFRDNQSRVELRKVIFDAIGKYFVIDPTKMGKLRVRLSETKPENEQEERGWDSTSVKFHSKALPIDDASDGVKAFCGVITAISAGGPKILLIDEPEAFLHPGLSSRLGKEIGKSLLNSEKRCFASTHSANFLMGCVQSGTPLSIIRLTYKAGVPTARTLPQEKVLHLMRHPLLRSTGILNGLFYESVIVCEADSDRAFYQEINERLLAAGDLRGIQNCLFINAQNKQTVWDIVKPLRELGIPTVGIVDIDVVKEGGTVFSKLLEGAYVPAMSHTPLQGTRSAIKLKFDQSGKDMKREGGVDVLVPADKEASNNFFQQLDEYGVFVLRRGELESWLKSLGATGHGPAWLIAIFQLMGENPTATNYIKPTAGDVWDFIGSIKTWMENPTRKGIPN
jgi:ABC-type cobalamin/Fe3+-siderophores transport system ATPase subunit